MKKHSFTGLVAISGGLALTLAAGCAADRESNLTDGVEFGDVAPLMGTEDADVIPGEYIVVFNHDTPATYISDTVNRSSLRSATSQVQVMYSVIPGFAATLDDSALLELRRDPQVSYIEANRIIRINAVQDNATWGLDRIDQRTGQDGSYDDFGFQGEGVHAYIIDTGVRTTHNEFTRRTGEGFSAINDGQGFEDCHGHGTHVAGTVAGTEYGVAKAATVHAVRVLDCRGSGTLQGVIDGVNWVANNHQSPAVANMSLGGSASQAIDDAVANLVASGVVVAVAAGNDNANACNSSPARVDTAITVGASNSSDARASFSNFGTCVDIFAPGRDITSAWLNSDSDTNTISGTSMASPHVAGVIAQYLGANPDATPADVADGMVQIATTGRLGGVGSGSPNELLYNNFDKPEPDDPPTDPGDPNDPPGDANSCVGSCNGQAAGGCFCDFWCLFFGDCCSDMAQACGIGNIPI